MRLSSWIHRWLLLVGVAVIVAACNQPESSVDDGQLLCDAENTLAENGKTFFTFGTHRFEGGSLQSTDFAHSGKWSMRLDADHQYGMGYDLPVAPEERYQITAWRRKQEGKPALLVVDGGRDVRFYRTTDEPVKTEGEWEQLLLEVQVPPHFDVEKLRVFLWNPGKEEVYLDDLRIVPLPAITYPEIKGLVSLQILLEQEALQRLEAIRLQAFQHGMLVRGPDDWVKARLVVEEGDTLRAKIRLKGDWLDHLKGRKWSFRVELKDEQWRGMRVFSLQNPAARSFLHQWLLHQLFRQENVLATIYDFAAVKLNGESLGMYAYEEHFTLDLPEAMGRPAAPILRFEENGFWEEKALEINDSDWVYFPNTEAAVISTFDQKAVRSDPNHFLQFLQARDLLHAYRNLEVPASEIFEVEYLASYLAITDLALGHHSLDVINERYCVTPSGKLEPVAYDAYPEGIDPVPYHRRLLGYPAKEVVSTDTLSHAMLNHLFNDPQLVEAYREALQQYSKASFVEAFLQQQQQRLDQLETQLQKEYTDYSYNRSFLSEQAKRIQEILPAYTAQLNAQAPVFEYSQEALERAKSADCNPAYFLPGVSVRAYLLDWQQLQLLNYHCAEIEIVGTGNSVLKPSQRFEKPIQLPAYRYQYPSMETVVLEKGAQREFVFFRLVGQSVEHCAEIQPWPAPGY